MSIVNVAVGVLVDREGRILVALRDKLRHQGGLWEFPGGKIEVGESSTMALRREFAEEVGLIIHSASPVLCIEHDYGDKCVRLHVLYTRTFSGVAEGKEGQSIDWVTPSQLTNLSFPAANQSILTYINRVV